MKAQNILQTIGGTPHIRINRLFAGASQSVWIAIAVDWRKVSAIVARPRRCPASGSISVKITNCSGAASSPASLRPA